MSRVRCSLAKIAYREAWPRSGNADLRAEVMGTDRTLTCARCGTTADVQAQGWRVFYAEVTEDPEEPAIVVVYCPPCAEREFGPPKPPP